MISCAASTNYNSSPQVYYPDLPQSVKSAGKVTKMPKGPADGQQLLVAVVANERKNARAVNQCIGFHKQLQTLYNSKQ